MDTPTTGTSTVSGFSSEFHSLCWQSESSTCIGRTLRRCFADALTHLRPAAVSQAAVAAVQKILQTQK
mgnify:CR=1 FL=1